MATRKLTYVAASNLTITIASLASSATLVAGEQSSETDNSAVVYLDYLLSGKFKTGTSPTAGRIEVWVVAELDDSSYPDVITGAGDAAKTFTTLDIKVGAAALAWSQPTDTTTGRTYPMGKVSVAGLFNGVCPRKFVVFVTHNTVAALDATGGSHQVTTEGVYETIA